MKSHYVGPYKMVSRCKNSLYTLKDKDSHVLKKPISGSHLVWFYGSKIDNIDRSTWLTPDKFESIPNTSCANEEYDMSFDFNDSCKCINVYQITDKESMPITSMPIKIANCLSWQAKIHHSLLMILKDLVWAPNKWIVHFQMLT